MRGLAAVILSAATLLSSATFVSACHRHARATWTAQPLQTNIVRVMPAVVKARGDLLYVDTTILNVGQVPVVVDRDAVRAILYNGRVIPRSSGTFTRHTPYTIPPGAAQAVNVDFRADGFDWNDMVQVAVDFTGAVLVNGAPVQLPPIMLTSHADE